MGLEHTRPPAKWTGGAICIINSDGCAVFGTSWERAVFGCGGLQPSEFASPPFSHGLGAMCRLRVVFSCILRQNVTVLPV